MISPRPIPPRALTLSLLACAVAFVATGCNAPGKPGPEPEVPRPEQVLDFATLYSQNCAACHGENGRNGAAIALANPVYLAIAGSANIQRITADGVPWHRNASLRQIQRRHVDRSADRHSRPGHATALGQPRRARRDHAAALRRCCARQSRAGPAGFHHLLRALSWRRRNRGAGRRLRHRIAG
jgi:hypothetical protein